MSLHLTLVRIDCANLVTQGSDLLQHARFNKGTGFTKKERDIFGLHGLLPSNVQTLKEQVGRAYDQYSSRENALAKNTFMTSMYEQNVVLYFKVKAFALRYSYQGLR